MIAFDFPSKIVAVKDGSALGTDSVSNMGGVTQGALCRFEAVFVRHR